MREYLAPTFTIDCATESIKKKASSLTSGCTTDTEKAISLFYFVRDSIPYSLYMISVFEEDFIASRVLDWGKGYCVQKAVLLASLARASHIPTRLAFAKIRNNKVPEKIVKMSGGNVFPRHGYCQFFLDDKWVSAAPTFNGTLCSRIGVPAVEFNGKDDALLPEKDLDGNPYIEYVEKYGEFTDLPFEWIRQRISRTIGDEKRPWIDGLKKD